MILIQHFLKRISNHYSSLYKAILFVFSILILVLIFPREGKFKYDFQKGKPWHYDDLIATVDFAILKSEEEITEEKEEALKNIKPLFTFRDDVKEAKRKELSEQFNKNWQLKYKTRYERSRLQNEKLCLAIFDSLFNTGIIERNQVVIGKDEDYSIVVIKDHLAIEKELFRLFTLSTAHDYIQNAISSLTWADAGLLIPLLDNALQHNIIFNNDLTEREKQSVIDEISLSRGMIQTGQRIISKGELITAEKFQMIESMREEYEKTIASSSSYRMILIGKVMLVSISMLVLILFLVSFKSEIFTNNKKLFLILILIIMMVGITGFVVRENVDLLYLVPICILPVIIRAFFDARLALFVHIVTIIQIGFMVPNSFEFIFMQLIAGIIAIISVLNLEKRAQFFLTSVYIFFTYVGIYFGMNLLQEGGLKSVQGNEIAFYAGSATLTLFSYPLIYIFEKIFGFYTDVSLMELSNTRSKLLRELAIKAPGTFQHSMLVANIAEEALYAIGGNALLARTGALYHDIGKIDNPQYFIENQLTEINPHDELSYEESAAIITRHVIRGVEIAKKNKIPEAIIDFIRTHHGTRKTAYFYAKQRKEFPDSKEVSEVFSYKGPVPFSKETSIVMMADSVEAASRSMKNRDEKKINDLVDTVIDDQIASGQFMNAAITFRDITILKRIFKRKLMNIYHIRVEYPK